MARIVGDSYVFAIGDTEFALRQTSAVPKAPTRTFWSRVEEALRDRGKPTKKAYVAELLGIKPPSINDWTKLGGFPTIQNTISLAKHLDYCAEWLLTERGPKRPLPQDAAAQELWTIWPHLDDATKVKLVSLAGTAYGRLRRDNDESAEDRRSA